MILPLDRRQVANANADGGNGRVTVGFRPEECSLVSAAEGGMPVTVDLVEETGADALVYGAVALEGQTERFVVRTDPRRVPRLGEIVYVKPNPHSHHAFHAVTGVRL